VLRGYLRLEETQREKDTERPVIEEPQPEKKQAEEQDGF